MHKTKSLKLIFEAEKNAERKRTIEAYSTILLLVLRDKFEFEPEKLNEVIFEINEHFDAMFKGYFNMNDAREALKKEGIEFGLNWEGKK